MPTDDFFPPRPPATPTIYAFASTHPDHAGHVGTAECRDTHDKFGPYR